MVSELSILFMVISAVLSIILPVALAIFLCRKYSSSVTAVLVGALTFILSQVVLRLPLLNLLNQQSFFIKSIFATNYIAASLFLGITAGIFEEFGRYIMFKSLLSKKLSYNNGLAFGIGHGGIEAILFAGFSMINCIIFSIAINNGTFDSVAGANMSMMQAYNLKLQLLNGTPISFLIAGIERVFAMTAHLSFSLIVLYGAMSKKFRYVLYAVLYHALLDSPLGILAHFGVNTYLIEAYIGIFAVISIVIIIKSKKWFEKLNNENKLHSDYV